MQEKVTLMTPGGEDPSTPRELVSSGLPLDLLRESAERLRVLALLYSFVFFLAAIFPALVVPGERARLLTNYGLLVPSVLGIVLGIVVALAIRHPRISLATAMNLGLVFEIVSSYAIATAEFGDAHMLAQHSGFMGLSWVSVWVVLFTIVVPTTPRRALLTALVSLSSVAVVVGLVLQFGGQPSHITPVMFFFGVVFPYVLVAGMAWVGARVVYRLGTEVKRARELGSYQLVEKLGEGGMGEVWSAKHRMLARPAAIKLIRPALATARGAAGAVSEQAARRFEREAQVIANLRSPHTVNLFDFGMAADGSFYYAMEMLDGLDADTLVRRFGPLPAERAIHVLRQVCHSLSEAHSRGLVHRDVKPANIFLCRYGEEFDFVKVLDFGIVGAVRELGPAETMAMQTIADAVLGTPAFIAPEQARGDKFDGRADLYAVGCVAYWLLTGELVFESDTAMGLLLKHTQTEPVPPSKRLGAELPAGLDEIILSCLAKDPAKRPQSARELALRLSVIPDAGRWTQEEARAWWTANVPATD